MDSKMIKDVIDMINLYKSREATSRTNLVISKDFNDPNKRIISVNYGDNYFNKVDFSFENGMEFDNQNVFEIINFFKKDEIYREDSVIYTDEFNCTYQCTFDSGRKVILENVGFILVNLVKSSLTGQVYQLDVLKANQMQSSFNYSNGGFANNLLLIVTILLVLDVVSIAFLWLKYMS